MGQQRPRISTAPVVGKFRELRAVAGGAFITQIVLALVGVTGFVGIMAWICYAAASGRNLKQRLTDPDPIDKAPANLATAGH